MRRNFLHRMGALLLTLAMALSLAVPALAADVASVTVNKSSFTLNKDDSEQLTATVTDADGNVDTTTVVSWTSDDSNVATWARVWQPLQRRQGAYRAHAP